jgi:hypothetical protein
MKTNQLLMHREIVAVCSETHTNHRNILCEKKVEFRMLNLAVHIETTRF